MQKVDYHDGDTIIEKRVVTVYPNCNNALATRFVINCYKTGFCYKTGCNCPPEL